MKTGQKRMVHTTVWASAQVSRLCREARLTYIGTITLGDDDGRFKGSPALVRSEIFPYDDDVKVADVAKWLKEIEDQNLLVGYQKDGEQYYYHPKWEEYQHIREDRRRESHIPAPDMEFPAIASKRQPNDNQVATNRPHKISKDKISKENITLLSETSFVQFWERYPKKVGRKVAFKAWQKVAWTPELVVKAMGALEAWKQSDQWTKDAGRYIPHPATWINGERWEDEIKTSASKSTKYANTPTKTVRG